MEDWLYDEGEDEKKSVYVAKLAELKVCAVEGIGWLCQGLGSAGVLRGWLC